MNWEDIGAMLGYNLSSAYFKNQHDKWTDEGRKALQDMADVNDSDKMNAARLMQGQLGGDEIIGQDPQTLLLKQKRNYMQALNDKQYLLDNGYSEDAKEVKEFDAKMNAAHQKADVLRAYAKQAGIDFGGVGDGMNLQQLNHAVNRREYPALYDASRYDLSQNLPHDTRLWADMSAGYVLGQTNTPPTFGAQPGAMGTGAAVAPQNVVGVPQAAAVAPQSAAIAPQGVVGAPQIQEVPGTLKPASELTSNDLMAMLGGAPNFREDPFGIRGLGAKPGNAFSPGAGNVPANQGATARSAYRPQMAQDGAGGVQTAESSVGTGQVAGAPTGAPQASGSNPYAGLLMGQAGGMQKAPDASNRITAKSIYEYLQSIGEINKNVDYDAAIDQLAKAFAEERVRRMSDEDKRAYLVSHGIGNDIASIVIPEANAKARDKARQEAVAKMAASATNPMMAEALSLMSLTDGAKPGDFMNAIKSTKPEMGYKDTDLGGMTQQIAYDKNGWLKPTGTTYINTLSPKAILDSRDKEAQRQLSAGIADARNQTSLAVAGMNNKGALQRSQINNEAAFQRTKYAQDSANARTQYAAERADARAAAGRSRGSGGADKTGGGMKRSEALAILKQAGYWDEDHPGEEWANPLNDARDEALRTLNDYGNVDPDDDSSAYSFGQTILEENARMGYPYTKEQLKQIIASIGGYGEQVAEDLLSGQGESYAK